MLLHKRQTLGFFDRRDLEARREAYSTRDSAALTQRLAQNALLAHQHVLESPSMPLNAEQEALAMLEEARAQGLLPQDKPTASQQPNASGNAGAPAGQPPAPGGWLSNLPAALPLVLAGGLLFALALRR